MVIPEEQVVSKKKVGKSKGEDVYHLKLKGGLHIMAKGPQRRVLGAASHRAVARHLAQKFEPEVEWTELSKSEDHVSPDYFDAMVPYYEDVTRSLRDLQDKKDK